MYYNINIISTTTEVWNVSLIYNIKNVLKLYVFTNFIRII